MKNSTLLFVLLLSLYMMSCASYKDITLGDVKSVKVNKVSNGGIEIQAGIQVANPNNYKVKVKKIEADMLVNGKVVGKIELNNNVTFPKKSDKVHDFIVNTQLKTILSAVPSILLGGEFDLQLKGYIKGKVFIVSKKFPIAVERKLSSKDFDIF